MTTENPAGAPPANFILRPARAEELAAMLAVLEPTNMHHVPSAEMPELDYRCCFVAESAGRIIGMSGYKLISATEAKTTLMAVLPGFRGWNIGKALQVRRMEALLALGVRWLITNADRPETIAWYKKHFGYREIGTLAKLHEFGRADIDHWTTLRTDLVAWSEQRGAA